MRNIDAKNGVNNTFHKGQVMKTGKPSKIVCAVRKTGVTVTVDGKDIISYKDDPKRLSVSPDWAISNNQVLFLGTQSCVYHITKMELSPISGQGKALTTADSLRPVDLLKLIRPDKDAVKGKWSFQGDTLISPADATARLQIPYEPPAEYDVTVVTERKAGNDSFCYGLVVEATLHGLPERLACRRLSKCPNQHRRQRYQRNNLEGAGLAKRYCQQNCLLGSQDRRDRGRGREDHYLLQGRSEAINRRLASSQRPGVYVGTQMSVYSITKMELTPISGQGKVLTTADSVRPVDLLKLIRPDKDAVKGKWSFQGDTLISPADATARLQIPYEPPAEYDVTLNVERKSGNNSFVVGLMVGGRQCQVEMDGTQGTGTLLTCLRQIDGTTLAVNPTLHKGQVLDTGKVNQITCSVRKAGVTLSVNGKSIFSFRGGSERLSTPPDWQIPNKRVLFLGSYSTVYHITKMELAPISGQGKALHYLSDMKEYDVVANRGLGKGFITGGDPELGRQRTDQARNRIVVSGTGFPHGLGLHPPGDRSIARVRYRIDKQYPTFLSEVAVNDSASSAGAQKSLDLSGVRRRQDAVDIQTRSGSAFRAEMQGVCRRSQCARTPS